MSLTLPRLALAASLITLSLSLPVLSVRSAPGQSDAGETVSAQVILIPDQIMGSNAKAPDQAALIAALKAYWDHYLHMTKPIGARGGFRFIAQ
jgi:hypothetical protein